MTDDPWVWIADAWPWTLFVVVLCSRRLVRTGICIAAVFERLSLQAAAIILWFP
jgi:hypothetical protein